MALFAVLAVRPVAAEMADLTATLTGDAEVPPVDTDATGSATVDINTEAAADAQLCYDVSSTDLEGGVVTGAHIHEGAAGENGPVVVTLQAVIDDNGTGADCATDAEIDFAASGDADIATLLTDIAANPANYYVNVHTTMNTGGEIRGQLEVAGGGGEATGMVMVMKHLCDASIQSEADFIEVEERSLDNPTTPAGVPSLGSTIETVLACPTIVQPGDDQTPDAIASGSRTFDFTVEDSEGTQVLTEDTTFSGDNGFDTPLEDFACEDTVDGMEYDANRNGEIDGDVCLDFSAYGFAGVVEGEVTVDEIEAPPSARFGTVRLTPAPLSDDAAIGLRFSADGVITFDSSADEDTMVTLHVYNFVNVAAAASDTPAPTPAASELPDAALDAGVNDTNPLAPILALVATTSLGVISYRTLAARRAR